MSHREYEYQAYQDRMKEADDAYDAKVRDIERQYESLGKPAKFEIWIDGDYKQDGEHINEAIDFAAQYEDYEIELKHIDNEMA